MLHIFLIILNFIHCILDYVLIVTIKILHINGPFSKLLL